MGTAFLEVLGTISEDLALYTMTFTGSYADDENLSYSRTITINQSKTLSKTHKYLYVQYYGQSTGIINTLWVANGSSETMYDGYSMVIGLSGASLTINGSVTISLNRTPLFYGITVNAIGLSTSELPDSVVISSND